MPEKLRFAFELTVDTGGTFTDVIALEGGRLSSHKLPSTPFAFERAVVEGMAAVAGGRDFDLLHSTTVATNALLERKGARTALVTTRGFRDLLEIGRQNRPFLYDLTPCRPVPLVPRELRFEISERIDSRGEILEPIREAEFPELLRALRDAAVESVAVVFLFSFLRPEHELRLGRYLRGAGYPVSLSHEILPAFREYERGATTVANAFVRPAMEAYLQRLAHGTEAARSLRIVQSNGGCLSPARAGAEAVHTLLSGPAAGILGVLTAARAGKPGAPKLITFDMGGTSTDVALVDGDIGISTEQTLAGMPIGVPMVDVHTVGAGGGSIARLDAGGALRVGPESAGAHPGPACYGHFGGVTVTDAHLVLGRLLPRFFLGGRMALDATRSWNALQALGDAMGGLTAPEAASEVLRLVNAGMEAAIRVISIERGHDPRDFTLAGFGGAGGLHVFALAEALEMSRVLIPCHPGVLSALGAAAMPLRMESRRTWMARWGADAARQAPEVFGDLRRQVLERFESDGLSTEALELRYQMDLRYVGQSFELPLPVEPNDLERVAEAFHALHGRRYGHADLAAPIEAVTLRVNASAPAPVLELPPLAARRDGDPEPRQGQAPGVGPIWHRAHLRAGDRIVGPALVVEDYATHGLPAGWSLDVDPVGNLLGTRS